MNELAMNFRFETAEVRTMLINNEPWFVGVDVALALGYSNPRDALAKHVDPEDKGVAKCDTPGGLQEMTVINEPGVYSLTFSSQLESAKKFKRWVTHEVLPSIREKGYYTALTPEDTIKALAKGMEYDHFMEDVVFPAIEMQDEFTFDKLLEHYCGYPVSSMDDLKHAKTIFNQTSKERKQRLSELRYNVNDYVNDDDMYRRISRFKWAAPENRGHYKTIKGVRWFDDFILERLAR